ncbi:MAG: hypothetical protein ACM3SM_03245 [Bacteroidota bacterium]
MTPKLYKRNCELLLFWALLKAQTEDMTFTPASTPLIRHALKTAPLRTFDRYKATTEA